MNSIAVEQGISTKAVLKPEMAELVMANSRSDLLWLRDNEGIVFDGLDYEGLPTHPPALQNKRVDRISDLLQVDERVRDTIEHLAMERLSTSRASFEEGKLDLKDRSKPLSSDPEQSQSQNDETSFASDRPADCPADRPGGEHPY